LRVMSEICEEIKAYYRIVNSHNYNDCRDKLLSIINRNSLTLPEFRNIVAAFSGIDFASESFDDKKKLWNDLFDALQKKIESDFARKTLSVEDKKELDYIKDLLNQAKNHN